MQRVSPRRLQSLAGRAVGDLRRASYPVRAAERITSATSHYPIDLRPVTSRFRLDERGIVVVPAPSGDMYRNPVSVSMYALGRHTAALDAGLREYGHAEAAAETAAMLRQARYLRDSQDGEGGWRYPVPVLRYGVPPGWYSGMAQGLAISVLLRAAAVTDESSFTDAAVGAATLLLRPTNSGGCSEYDAHGRPFLEECPANPPSHILNGALFALLGLCEFGTHFGTGIPAQAAERLRQQLARFDLGYWSSYDLSYRAPSSYAYHCLHIALLEATGQVLTEPGWSAVARRWDGYARNPAYRLRAMTAKARFVLASQ
jgi:hypothetical protein